MMDIKEKRISLNILQVFAKTSTGSGIKLLSNQQLANEFHEPLIRKF